MKEESLTVLRETDRWLRKVSVFLPIVSFFVGLATGVITTYLLFRDLDRRVSILESQQEAQDTLIRKVETRQERVLSFIDEKFKMKMY